LGDAMPYNLGNPEEVTMLELAEMIRRLTGTRSSIEFRPLPEDDPKQRRPDITRARSELGWGPEVGLEAGLERTLAYFREALVA
jgi:UDP-glucuronate decarboxylase